MPIYTPSLLSVDAKETRRYAGLAKAEFDEAAIAAACEECALLAAPRVQWEVYDYDCKENVVRAEPPFTLEGNSIRKHLAGAGRVVFLAATIGEAVEDAVTRHFDEGSYAHSVLLDAAATKASRCAGVSPPATATGTSMPSRSFCGSPVPTSSAYR